MTVTIVLANFGETRLARPFRHGNNNRLDQCNLAGNLGLLVGFHNRLDAGEIIALVGNLFFSMPLAHQPWDISERLVFGSDAERKAKSAKLEKPQAANASRRDIKH